MTENVENSSTERNIVTTTKKCDQISTKKKLRWRNQWNNKRKKTFFVRLATVKYRAAKAVFGEKFMGHPSRQCVCMGWRTAMIKSHAIRLSVLKFIKFTRVSSNGNICVYHAFMGFWCAHIFLFGAVVRRDRERESGRECECKQGWKIDTVLCIWIIFRGRQLWSSM